MTENEAIKELSYDNTAYGGRCTEEVRRVAIHALSEIQQYRAIGTVDECKNSKIIADERYNYLFDEIELLRAYASIGTIDEFKVLKEKNEPKKPDYEADGYADGELVYDYAKCPICGHDFEYGINDWGCEYCSDCGQKLDWQ